LPLGKGYEAGQYWSSRFIKELQATICGSEELQTTLGLYIKDYQQTKTLLLEATVLSVSCVNNPNTKSI